jgi:opacity protein-like surface antigen
MKNRYLASVALTAMSLYGAQVAQAQQAYVSVFAGGSVPGTLTFDDSYGNTHYSLGLKTGYLIGGAVGVTIADALRVEIELSHAAWKAADTFHSSAEAGFDGPADGSVNATYVMANGWFDLDTGSAFTPYIGGGAGAAWLNGDVSFFGAANGFGAAQQAAFAYQVGGGVKFDVNENLALDVGYRFKSILNGKNDNLNVNNRDYINSDLNSHNIQVGLTYKF